MRINVHLLILVGLLIPFSLLSQEETIKTEITKQRKDGFGVGFKLNQVQGDFGLGLDFTSPSFIHNSVSVRLNTLYFFREHFSTEEGENTWTPYFVGRLGLVGIGGKPAPFLRLYGEGGCLIGIGSNEFTSEDNFFGGYGLFGFEFFMSQEAAEIVSYYIELGGTGGGGRADKIFGNPIYHNGFTIGSGFRFYF